MCSFVRPVLFIVAGMAAGILIWLVVSNVRISVTNSAGARVFVVKQCEYTVGEFVEVKVPPDDPFVPKGALLIKRIACGPGQTISRKGLDYFCDGVRVATAKLKARDGRPLTPWKPRGDKEIIPKDMFFLANPGRDSYDSRYLGLFSKDKIVNCLSPVL